MQIRYAKSVYEKTEYSSQKMYFSKHHITCPLDINITIITKKQFSVIVIVVQCVHKVMTIMVPGRRPPGQSARRA